MSATPRTRPPTLPDLIAPLNAALTPALKLGFANPYPLTCGIVLLEVPGRRSGVLRTTPLICADYGSLLAVSTVRDDSQWVRNLAASPRASIWLRGRRRPVLGMVFRKGERLDTASLPDDPLARAARTFSTLSQSSLALLHLQ